MASLSDSIAKPSSPDSVDLGESPLKLAATLTRSKQFPWYQESFGSRLTPTCRQLLEEYSRIPPAEVESHVYKMVRVRNSIILSPVMLTKARCFKKRDVAWEIFPFPCIGEFWYLTLGLSNHPKYDELLARMKNTSSVENPVTLMDLGTCFGQDLRKLAHDGVSPSQLLGVDVFSAFEQLGQQFFRDADRFVGRFRTADIFATDSSLTELHGSQDIVTATMVLHSFDWPTQVLACKKMLALARGAGSWLMGGLSASVKAGEHLVKPPFVPEGVEKNIYRHNRDSLIHMWGLVGEELGMKLDVYAEYESGDTEARRAAEEGGANVFAGFEQKLLWFRVQIIQVASDST
jgi:hypothetical protein